MAKQRVLFLCVHNSARSQLAEGLLRAMAGDRFEVSSAGSEPTHPNPFALRVLQDEGIDVSQHRSKSVGELISQRFDYVITLCAEEICPVFPGAVTRLHWALPDPAKVEGSAEEKLEAFRRTAAELKRRLNEFVATQSVAVRP
jgi:arsenate reductase (thioredoxin)